MDHELSPPKQTEHVVEARVLAQAGRAQLEEMLPVVLGRYALEALIGEGGMARVFRAVRKGPAGFEKTVAIKLMKSAVQTPKAHDDFRQEAVFSGRLNHPNLVDVYELNEDSDCPYIAMEWVDGLPLHHLTHQNGPLPPSAFLDLFIGLLSGLRHAHAGEPAIGRGGMLHRDIKPSNIIVSRHGVPKLVDFGIAAQLDLIFGHHQPSQGMAIGTLNWMSPEQLKGQRLDGRTDLFSLGLVMATTALGTNPAGNRRLYELISTGQAIPGCLISLEEESNLDDYLPGLGRVIAAMVQRDVGARPRDAREVWVDLQQLRQSAGHQPTLAQWMLGEASEASSPSRLSDEPTVSVEGDPSLLQGAETRELPAGNLNEDGAFFVGRASEFDVLSGHIAAGSRVVTTLGTGGAGKTRLSRRAACSFGRQLAGGAWFVDLSAVDTMGGVVRSVAGVLGVRLERETSAGVVDALGQALAARGRFLLVLDNVEQLTETAAEVVSKWLTLAPEVQFMVTSRESLRIEQEEVVKLDPLPLGDAVKLLQECAKKGGKIWQAGSELESVHGQIVNALDRLPLAIELAGSRAHLLSPDELYRRLTERFKLLKTSGRNTVQRQSTLHRLIDWSWQQLEPWEQSALSQISCFRGGFSMDSAEAVIDLSNWPDAPWVLDVVTTLLEKSLIHTKTVDERPRMFAYESIREFASLRLREDAAGTQKMKTQARHAAHFAGFSSVDAGGGLSVRGPGHFGLLRRNFDNLWAAAGAGVAVQSTLCALGALEVLQSQGPLSQAAALADRAINGAGVTPALALRLYMAKAESLRRMGRIDQAREALRMAVETSRLLQDGSVNDAIVDLNEVAAGFVDERDITNEFEIDRRIAQARLLRAEGRSVEARTVLEEALALCSPSRNPTVKARVQHDLGLLIWSMVPKEESLPHLRQARAAFQVAGQVAREAESLSAFAFVSYRFGKSRSVRPMLEEAVALFGTTDEPAAPRKTLSMLASVEVAMEEYAASQEHFDRAIALHAQVGDVMAEAICIIDRARLYQAQGRYEEAESNLKRVIIASRQRDPSIIEAMADSTLAELYIDWGRPHHAVDCFRRAAEAFDSRIIPLAAQMRVGQAQALAQIGEVDLLDELTLGMDELVSNIPREEVTMKLRLAEVRLIQQERAAAYRHLQRAKDLLVDFEDDGAPWFPRRMADLEHRILGR